MYLGEMKMPPVDERHFRCCEQNIWDCNNAGNDCGMQIGLLGKQKTRPFEPGF